MWLSTGGVITCLHPVRHSFCVQPYTDCCLLLQFSSVMIPYGIDFPFGVFVTPDVVLPCMCRLPEAWWGRALGCFSPNKPHYIQAAAQPSLAAQPHHGVALCCAVLCCAVLCCAVLCCAVLCCAVLCCAVLLPAACCYSHPIPVTNSIAAM